MLQPLKCPCRNLSLRCLFSTLTACKMRIMCLFALGGIRRCKSHCVQKMRLLCDMQVHISPPILRAHLHFAGARLSIAGNALCVCRGASGMIVRGCTLRHIQLLQKLRHLPNVWPPEPAFRAAMPTEIIDA